MLLIVQLSSFHMHPIKPEVIVWVWEFASLHQRCYSLEVCCSRGSSFSLAVRPHPSLAIPPGSANGLSVTLAKIQTAVTWLTQLLPQPARLWISSRDPLRWPYIHFRGGSSELPLFELLWRSAERRWIINKTIKSIILYSCTQKEHRGRRDPSILNQILWKNLTMLQGVDFICTIIREK